MSMPICSNKECSNPLSKPTNTVCAKCAAFEANDVLLVRSFTRVLNFWQTFLPQFRTVFFVYYEPEVRSSYKWVYYNSSHSLKTDEVQAITKIQVFYAFGFRLFSKITFSQK